MEVFRVFTPGRILGIALGAIILLFVSRGGASVSAYQTVPTVQTPTAAQAGLTPTPTATTTPAVRIIMNETYVNALVKSQMAGNPTVSDPVVDLRPPNLALVTMTMSTSTGFSVRPTATIAFTVKDNHIVVNITKVSMAGLLVPRVLIQNQLISLQNQLEVQLNAATQPLDSSILELDHVSTTDNSLIVDLGFRPQTGLVPQTGAASPTPFPIITTGPSSASPVPTRAPWFLGF